MFLTTYFGLVTFWIAVGLAGRALRDIRSGAVRLDRAAFRKPDCAVFRQSVEDPDGGGDPEPRRAVSAGAGCCRSARNRLVTKYLLYLLPAVTGLCGLLPEWIPWAAIVAVYSSRYVSTLLDLLGLRSPERRSFDRLLEMNGYQWEVRRQLLRSHVPKIPFLVQVMKKHCAGKRVIIGVSERFGRYGGI